MSSPFTVFFLFLARFSVGNVRYIYFCKSPESYHTRAFGCCLLARRDNPQVSRLFYKITIHVAAFFMEIYFSVMERNVHWVWVYVDSAESWNLLHVQDLNIELAKWIRLCCTKKNERAREEKWSYHKIVWHDVKCWTSRRRLEFKFQVSKLLHTAQQQWLLTGLG